MSHVGVGPRAVMRSVAFLTAGVLAVPALAGCTSEDPAGKPLAEQDVAAAAAPGSPTAAPCAGPWTRCRTR